MENKKKMRSHDEFGGLEYGFKSVEICVTDVEKCEYRDYESGSSNELLIDDD